MANLCNIHKGEKASCFPVRLTCTHTQHSSSSSSSCSICLRVEELNRGVVETKRAQDGAVEQLGVFLEQVNRQYDPLQRLPVELAISIFLYLPRPPSLDVFDVTFTAKKHHALRPVPFILGSVCRYWRRIVWSTPQFWNVLWLYVRACGPIGRSRILREWLDRSGQLALYICMFLPNNIADEHQLPSDMDRSTTWESIDDMIDTVNHYIHRMKVLHLSLAGPQINRFGHKLVQVARTEDSNPTLERLSIVLEPLIERGWAPKSYQFKLGGRTESPTHVSFRNINAWNVHIHWGNVIYLEASQMSIRSALELLRLAPQMQHFKFIVLPYLDRDKGDPSHVTHHSLTSLTCESDDDSGTFLSLITCPALEKLSYRCELCNIPTFLERSACGLKDLTLDTFACVDDKTGSLLAIFHLTPLLTRLSFSRCTDLFGKFSGFLARHHFNLRQFLPHLLFLHVSSSPTHFQHFNWSRISSAIYRDYPNEKVDPHPISQVEVIFGEAVVDPSKNGSYVIDRKSLLQIMELVQEDRVEIEIKDREGLDLIALSRKFHNLD